MSVAWVMVGQPDMQAGNVQNVKLRDAEREPQQDVTFDFPRLLREEEVTVPVERDPAPVAMPSSQHR